MYFQCFTFAVKITLCAGAEVPVQVVPEGIQSVNGSNETMGCNGSFTDESESVTVVWLMVALQILTPIPLTGHLI